MKEAVKYIGLAIGSVLSFIAAFLAISLLIDEKLLQMPLLLILPVLSLIMFIITFVLLIVWGFKFSNNKPHKKILLATGITLIVSILVFLASSIVNPILNRVVYDPVSVVKADSTTQTQEEPTNYVSVADVTGAFSDELLWNTSYELNQILELEDENPDIVTRSYFLDKAGYDSIHFDYKYNRKSKQLYNMSMFIISENATQIEDFKKFSNLLARSIDPTENFDLNNISAEVSSKDFSKYRLFYTITDNHYNIMFTIK